MTDQKFATKRLQIVTDVKVYRPFEGANHKRMQRLLTGREGGVQVDTPRLPISPKQLMEARLGRIGEEGDKTYLRSRYVDTSTAVLPNPDDDAVKFVNEHSLIYGLNPDIELVGSNLPITPEQYARNNGFTLSDRDANALRRDIYALPKVRREAWEYFAEGDTKLAEDYIADVERSTGLKFDENTMGLYIPSSKGLRLLDVYSVDVGDRSDADGYFDLGYGNGRLVGVAAEPQLVAQKMGISLEELATK